MKFKALIWSNYSDLTQPHLKWWKVRDTFLFQGNLGWWNSIPFGQIYVPQTSRYVLRKGFPLSIFMANQQDHPRNKAFLTTGVPQWAIQINVGACQAGTCHQVQVRVKYLHWNTSTHFGVKKNELPMQSFFEGPKKLHVSNIVGRRSHFVPSKIGCC